MKTSTLNIRTPEGIVFSQQLAGPVTRFLACFIDQLCIQVVLILVTIIMAFDGDTIATTCRPRPPLPTPPPRHSHTLDDGEDSPAGERQRDDEHRAFARRAVALEHEDDEQGRAAAADEQQAEAAADQEHGAEHVGGALLGRGGGRDGVRLRARPGAFRIFLAHSPPPSPA